MIQENNAICCLFPQGNLEGLLKKGKEETRESKKYGKYKKINNFKTISLNAIYLFFLINSK